MEIKRICDALGIQLISYSPLGLGMLTGKYTPSKLPSGPRYINGGPKYYLPPFMPQYNHQVSWPALFVLLQWPSIQTNSSRTGSSSGFA